MTVIAMTREIGSRGTEVAAGVAGRLGLKIIRSEIVADSVAERLGIKASAFLRYMDGSASLFERWQIDRRKLLHYTAEEILGVAQQGNVLIKGWGAATHHLTQYFAGDVRIARRRIKLRMPQNHLDQTNIGTVLKKMRREAVTQCMW